MLVRNQVLAQIWESGLAMIGDGVVMFPSLAKTKPS